MVKVRTLQITWHAKEGQKNDPILSIDFHPTLPLLASAGADSEIKLWRLVETAAVHAGAGVEAAAPQQSQNATVEYAYTLLGHTRTVNSVRWSPNGECLASVSDDGSCIVWHPQLGLEWNTIASERQIQRQFLKRHTEDVYDVAWSPDSRRVLTGSVDNTCIVWDVAKGKDIAVLEGHGNFVQGVCWDPAGNFLVSQSNDRTVRVYRENTAIVASAHKGAAARRKLKMMMAAGGRGSRPYQCLQIIKTRTIEDNTAPAATAEAGAGAGASSSTGSGSAPQPALKHHVYLDENVPSFFRRPAWTPDGSLLVTPCGSLRTAASASTQPRPTTYVFQRGQFATPLAHLPCATSAKPSIIVRPSPVIYAHRSPAAGAAAAADGSSSSNGAFDLPYRMLIAVATLDAVVIYDTSIPHPVAAFANLHYDKLTDMAWSPSGSTLLLSSIDGYCSMAAFEASELGDRLSTDHEAYPAFLRDRVHESVFNQPPKPKKERKNSKKDGNGAAASGAASETDGGNGDGAEIRTPSKATAAAAAAADATAEVSPQPATISTLPVKRKAALTFIAPLGEALPVAPLAAAAAATVVAVKAAAPTAAVVHEPQAAAKPAPVAPVAMPSTTSNSSMISLGSLSGMSALGSILGMIGSDANKKPRMA